MGDLITYNSIKNNQLNPSATTLSGLIQIPCTMLTVGTTFSATLTAERYTIDGHHSWIQDVCSTFNINDYVTNGNYTFQGGDQGTHRLQGKWVLVIGSGKYDTSTFTASAPITNPLLRHEITNKSDYGTAKLEFTLSKNVTSESQYNTYFKGKYITAKGWKLSNNSWTPVALIFGERILSIGGWDREGCPASQCTYGGIMPLLSWTNFAADAAVYSNINDAMYDFFNHNGELITAASSNVMWPGTIRNKGSGWSSWSRVYEPQFVY